MRSKLLALSAAVLALVIVSAFSSPADARRGGHGFGGARHHFGGHFHARPHFRFHGHRHFRGHFAHRPFFHHRRFHHRRFHRRVFIGVPLIYGGYYAYGDCYWLRRRALYTGSSYWWNRYYACIGYY